MISPFCFSKTHETLKAIDVTANGKPYQEMQVDGGAMAQVFVYPPALKLADVSKDQGVVRDRKLHVIRNA